MDNTITALQGLYVALGGSSATVANMNYIPDLINAIATQAATITSAATTKELPAVTATNNGSVLKVVDGKWAIGTDAT